MPTWLIERGYRFGIFSADCVEPPHVHVVGHGGAAKFWLEPVELAQVEGYNAHRVRLVRSIVDAHGPELLRKWHEFCDQARRD